VNHVAGRAPRVTGLANAVIAEVGILGNPYLLALADGSMPLDDFRVSQEQFGFAVTYFARPMAVLVSRIADPGERVGILRNIVEEHGDFRTEAFHRATFRQFLASIGSDDAEHLDSLIPWPAVTAFNSVLAGVCATDDLVAGVCCMGVIEHAFARISASIGRSVVERGWVPRDKLVHYALHAEIDERHAEDFFVMAEPLYDDPQNRSRIDQGLRLGGYVFNRLYADLDAHQPPAGQPAALSGKDARLS
jgi:pyrroloquinoline-quinone synthase